jgi:uncharacterized protein YjdB
MRKNHLYLIKALALVLLISGCRADEIDITDEAIPSGGGSTTTELVDPALAWSKSACTAYLGSDSNSYPTLTNEYGVSVTYLSSNTDVATVSSSGVITLVAEGTTTIAASYEEDDTYEDSYTSYILSVSRSASGLAWSAEEASILIGEPYSLPTLSNPNGLSVTYSSSDETIAMFEDASLYTISIISNGSITVTATSAETDKFEAGSVSYTLNITKNTDGISWSESSATVTIGAQGIVYPTLNNPGDQKITYSSSNPGVATIADDGTITLVSNGETTISATSEAKETDEVSYAALTVSYVLTVQAEGSNLVSPGFSWPESAYTATMGSAFTSPTLTNPNGVSVSYSSSNTDVATVASNGTVTILAAGSTTITATSEATDTYFAGSASYSLTVSLADPGIAWSNSGAQVSVTFGSFDKNDFPTLSNDNHLAVTFTSSDESVATVNSSGLPTPVTAGTTYIKAYYAGSDIYAEYTATYTLKISKGTPVLTWSASTYSASLEDSSWDFPTCTSSPEGLTFTYVSSNTSVATVNATTGVPALIATGTTTITATSETTDQYKSASASYTLTVTSNADDGAVTTSFDSAGSSDDDDISQTTFTRLVTITYSGTSAMVSGYNAVADVMDVSVSGAGVTITYTGSENVAYKLTGTASNGYFKLYSSKKQVLWLSGVSITNSSGAAINNQSGKRTFVYVDGTNTLADGSSAGYSTTGDEDMKGVFFSEGQLIFSGPSSGTNNLTVTASNAQSKSGIVSDDYIRMLRNAAVSVIAGSGAGHGLKANEYVQISDGTLAITTKASMKKGITSDGYVLVEGGTSTIIVSGGVAYDSDDGEYTGSAGIKADNYFGMTGGTVTITNSGSGGKGIRAGNYDYYSSNNKTLDDSYISGGNLTINTTGSESNDVSCKAIKIGFKEKSGNSYIYGGNLLVSGGATVASCSKSETVEVKGKLTISGGSFYASSTGDDAINSQGELNISGGYVYGYSTQNDAIDTNCDFKISGGYVYAITTKGSPEVALDANTEGGYKLYITGGVVVAYGGLESGYSSSNTVYTLSGTANAWNALHNGSSFIAAFKAPSSLSSFAVCAPSLKSGYKGVTVSGTTYCNGVWATSGISGGTSVTLSAYSGGSQGGGPGGGGNPGGGGPGGH